MNINNLYLSIRGDRVLRENGIETVEQLINLTYKDLRNMKGMGDRTINEILWEVIQIMNGEVLRRTEEWQKRFPSPRNYDLEIEKSKKFDKLTPLIKKLQEII